MFNELIYIELVKVIKNILFDLKISKVYFIDAIYFKSISL